MSRYLSKDEVLDFLASDNSKEEEISDSNWISTNDSKENREEYLCVIHLRKKE